MYRAGLESILGLRRHGDSFEMDPCIPSSWPGYVVTWRLGRTRYEISLANPERRCRGIASATLDGAPVDPRAVPLLEDGAVHEVRLVLGGQGAGAPPQPGDASTAARQARGGDGP
jgi:cyclic beta-1,2-glucan synthetase